MKRILSAFLLMFYILIVLYTLFIVRRIDTLQNCMWAVLFETIGFIAVAHMIFYTVFSDSVKVGYFVSLLMVTLLYAVVLNVINIGLVALMSDIYFVLLNLIVLFIYCLISIPMYLMDRR